MHRLLSAAFVSILLLAGCGRNDSHTAPPPILRLAVTTSTRDSGLLDELVPVFEHQHGVRVDVIAAGTGKALKLGVSGDVDVVLVHSRPDEDAFISEGHGIRREDVMYNTFELLGPEHDPAGVGGMPAPDALQAIATSGRHFVSRGDS